MVPLSYLLGSSDESLNGFAVNRLNQAANLQKEIKAMRTEAENLEVEAGVALWLRAHRKEILQQTGKHLERIEDVRARSDAA